MTWVPGATLANAAGTIVNLVTSTGACPVAVPNIVGLTQAQAITQITAAQLTYAFISSCPINQSSTGIVVSQTPAPLTMVTPGPATQVTGTLGCQ